MNRKFIASVSIAVLCIAITGGAVWKLLKEKNSTIELKLATGSKGGDYYNFGEAIRQVITQNQPNIKLQVIPTNGSGENMQLLEEGKVQLALVQNDTPAKPSARAIALIYPEVFHLIASQKSEIKSLEILALTETVRQTDKLEDLEKLRQELFKIFREVVQDLDTDRISTESFQSFAFSWQVAITTIHHKEIVAINKLHNPKNLAVELSEVESINNR